MYQPLRGCWLLKQKWSKIKCRFPLWNSHAVILQKNDVKSISNYFKHRSRTSIDLMSRLCRFTNSQKYFFSNGHVQLKQFNIDCCTRVNFGRHVLSGLSNQAKLFFLLIMGSKSNNQRNMLLKHLPKFLNFSLKTEREN